MRSSNCASMDKQTGDSVGLFSNAHQVFDKMSSTPFPVDLCLVCPLHSAGLLGLENPGITFAADFARVCCHGLRSAAAATCQGSEFCCCTFA
ncbi:hypothetical protein U1Q18_026915 [Sarracenia purpurea var. burkii]